MFYDRKIKYLDYLVKGERCGNAGFIKLEVRDTICNITINVNGLRTTDSLPVKLYLTGAGQESELCSLELVQGRGTKQLPGQNAQNIGGTGIAYNSLESVRIPISAEREIVAIIGTAAAVGQVDRKAARMVMADAMTETMANTMANTVAETTAETMADTMVNTMANTMANTMTETMEDTMANTMVDTIANTMANTITEAMKGTMGAATADAMANISAAAELETKVVSGKTTVEKKGVVPEKLPVQMERVEETGRRTMPVEGDAPATQATVPVERDAPAVQEKAAENKGKKVPLCDNKWRQLWEIYPHITPFRDEREYLSVGPNDFVILPEKYFRMANNSFLLHGYYNYKHLVLKRLEYRGTVRYYIGVPGNFYDREKQVALMFGFESFESLEEPASTGDYGYYLMRIEL